MNIRKLRTQNKSVRELLCHGSTYQLPSLTNKVASQMKVTGIKNLVGTVTSFYLNDDQRAFYQGPLILRTDDNKSYEIIGGADKLYCILYFMLAVLLQMKHLSRLGIQDCAPRVELLFNSYFQEFDPVYTDVHHRFDFTESDDSLNSLIASFPDENDELNVLPSKLVFPLSCFINELNHFLGFHAEGDIKKAKLLVELFEKILDCIFFTVFTVQDGIDAQELMLRLEPVISDNNFHTERKWYSVLRDESIEIQMSDAMSVDGQKQIQIMSRESDLDHLGAFKQLKFYLPSMRIISCTGYTMDEVVQIMKRVSGFTDLLLDEAEEIKKGT